MLPSFYQVSLEAQLNEIQLITLQMLVELLQTERRVSIERLATLFAQPILFHSRRKNIQRFLNLPIISPETLWFPIVLDWIQRHFQRQSSLCLVIDRTQWSKQNVLMVSVLYKNQTVPVFWMLLDKRGQSNLAEQQAVLTPVFELLADYDLVLLGDREFHGVPFASWLMQQSITFVLRLPKSTTVQLTDQSEFERLDALSLEPGMSQFEFQIQVTQTQGFGKFNLVTRWKRTYRDSATDQIWYLLTNLEDPDTALKLYRKRFRIEPMFRTYKRGGYDLEACHANAKRTTALLVLIAIAYTISLDQGRRIRAKQVQPYVVRPKEIDRRVNRHTDFWIGLYGQIWLIATDVWAKWAQPLMRLKPQKRLYFLRGLRALSLIQSAF